MRYFPFSGKTEFTDLGSSGESKLNPILRLPSAFLLALLILLAGCAGLDPFSKDQTPQERFVDKITGAVWYQEFRNAHSRVPRISLTADPGIKESKLETILKKKTTILTLTKINPDFTLHIKQNAQAELLDQKNNVVWLAGTDGAVVAPPPAKPIVLWRGFYGGPRGGISEMSGSLFSGSSTASGVGVRLGYAFTNLGDISVYMPQISYDYLGTSTISTNLAGTSSILTGSVSFSDIMIDPLRFGFPLFSNSTLLSFAIGAGDIMLTQGIQSPTNPEIHLGIDLEYRLFENFAPYVEILAEEVFLSGVGTTANYTAGPESYSTPISQFGSSNFTVIRAMVGIDWYPWITKANVSGGSEP